MEYSRVEVGKIKIFLANTGCKQKNGSPPWKLYPLLESFSKQFEKFLTWKIKSKLVFVMWECTVTIKIFKIAWEMV